METLIKLVNKVVEVGHLEGFLISNSNSERMLISHFLFTNDFFFKPKESNLGLLRCILLLLEALSGLRVNLLKSVLFLIGEVPQFLL